MPTERPLSQIITYLFFSSVISDDKFCVLKPATGPLVDDVTEDMTRVDSIGRISQKRRSPLLNKWTTWGKEWLGYVNI